MIKQLAGEYRVRQAHLKPLHAEAKELLQQYDEVVLQHVPREENVDADALVNAALDAATSR
jgi:ribonuclease HI